MATTPIDPPLKHAHVRPILDTGQDKTGNVSEEPDDDDEVTSVAAPTTPEGPVEPLGHRDQTQAL
jgi:hypothetical protein